jgi:predicted RNA-binding Zn-ribbon protein involved in translation (DUF1610 family)
MNRQQSSKVSRALSAARPNAFSPLRAAALTANGHTTVMVVRLLATQELRRSWRVRAHKRRSNVVNPNCPNCDRPMILVRAPQRPEEQHTFECESCGVVYMTADHVPITGKGQASP